MTTNTLTYIYIIILPIISAFAGLIATFSQTLPFMKHSSYLYKLLTSEFWATINVLIYIPYLRIANKYFNPAQLILYVYFTSFAVQIFSNKYVFVGPIAYDDYVAIFIMLCALAISVYKVFG